MKFKIMKSSMNIRRVVCLFLTVVLSLACMHPCFGTIAVYAVDVATQYNFGNTVTNGNATNGNVTVGNIYDIYITENTTLTAVEGENIKVSGEGVVANITLPGVTINKSNEVSVSAIRVENGATVKLTVLGTNTLRGAEGCAGISVDETSTLIIEDASTGTLNAYGGLMAAGIGGDAECNSGTITIENGTINAYGGNNAGEFADDRGGAGIGGGNSGSGGNININGGNIYAEGGTTAAGIGGGNKGATGTIIINNGTIRANSGYQGAAIGGVSGSVEINGGDITADGWAYGAAIGCAYTNYGGGTDITINGGNIKAESSSFCAAIGGSMGDTAGNILITGGTIIADGEDAGIGRATSVTITGGTITATADAGGTGIQGTVTISGGVINATGGSDGAGIGGTSGTVKISGGTITARGGYNAAGIGGESGVGGCNIIITGGSIKAIPGSENAEAVGSGANGSASSVTNGTEYGNQKLNIVIIENVINIEHNKPVEIEIKAGNNDKEYLYIYSGYGHEGDNSLYFYLPETYSILTHIYDYECDSICNICGADRGVTHNEIKHSLIPATCTEPGYTAGVYCSLCNTWFSGHELIPAIGHNDNDNDNICDFCNKSMNDIIVSEAKLIEIIANKITYLKFTPSVSGKYTFTSNSGDDTYGYLYDAAKNQLASNDDGGSGYNFSVTYDLVAGQTYYWGARFYSSSKSGSFDVILTLEEVCRHEDIEMNSGTTPSCTSGGYTEGLYCNDCDAWIEGHEYISSLGHSYSSIFTIDKEATCITDGSKSKHCTRDGCTARTSITTIPATGHYWSHGECINCHITCETAGHEWENGFCTHGCDNYNLIASCNKTNIDFTAKNIITELMFCNSLDDIIEVIDGYTTRIFASHYGYIGTGSTVEVLNSNEEVIDTYTVVVNCDTNGDSVCDALDAWQVGLVSNGHKTLDGAYALAADSNSDDIVDINDYQSIVNRVVA